jgi:hypothetical protein
MNFRYKIYLRKVQKRSANSSPELLALLLKRYRSYGLRS